ncbi:MAG: MBL fold metallo-hydrolase [Kiritimatiellae bacterium]|nr:MBL fold metallo-hydrolase [Kiritimatiellia bacterium]
MIGCDCAVCRSSDPHNKRRRSSLYLQACGKHIVVDTTPDFRDQVLTFNIPRVDAVLFTHAHADHIFGFDDIRRFNTIQDCVIPAYASPESLKDLKRIFDYVGMKPVPGHFRPQIEFREITEPFDIGDINIVPIPVEHGPKETLGFLFKAQNHTVGYIPDCRRISDSAIETLSGIDVMILDALRHRPHKTHLTLKDSISILKRISAKQSYIIHMCHDLDHKDTERSLPDGINVSYDGMTVEL